MGKGMEMMRIRVVAAVALATMLHAGTSLAWEDYPGFHGPGHAGIQVGDFDGNGRSEAAVTGYAAPGFHLGGSQLLAVLDADATGVLGVRRITMLPTQLTGPLVPAPREGAADRLVAVAGPDAASQVLVLGGVPLRILRTIEAPTLRKVTAIADVDADGHPEMVGLTTISDWGDVYPVVLDYETGAVEWVGDTAATDVGVAQLDGDAARELILAATPGRIVDGVSHAVEWTYPGGFGNTILVGRFGNGADERFATSMQWSSYVQIFQSQPYSPVSEIDTGGVTAAAVVQLGPGGPDQIAIGGRYSGDIRIYDPRTGQALLSFEDPEHDVNALAAGDIDGDGHVEVVHGSGLTNSGTDILRAVDLGTLADDYLQNDEGGPHSAIARGDLQGGGSDQVAYLTLDSDSGYAGSNLYVLDAATGQRLRTRANVLESWTRELPRMAIASLSGAASQDIIIAGGYLYTGMVAVLDGTTLEDRWRVGSYDSVFAEATVRALGIIDASGDGVPDAVVATSAARVVVLDGRDGTVLWQSVTLVGDAPPSIAVFHGSAGTPQVAVARGAALYVFDLSSHLLVATTKTVDLVSGLWQWGDGATCRLAALDQAGIVGFHRCDTLAREGQRLMPEGTTFFRPLDAQANRFIAASGAYLYEVAADGAAIPMSGALGGQLGSENQGVLRAEPDGQHFDLLIGSDYMATRIRVGLDALFADGFD